MIDPTIRKAILDAMQPAEELGGPERGDYLDTMNWICAIATDRAAAYRAQLERDRAIGAVHAQIEDLDQGDKIAVIKTVLAQLERAK